MKGWGWGLDGVGGRDELEWGLDGVEVRTGLGLKLGKDWLGLIGFGVGVGGRYGVDWSLGRFGWNWIGGRTGISIGFGWGDRWIWVGVGGMGWDWDRVWMELGWG